MCPGSFEIAATKAARLGHNRPVIENGVCRDEWEDLAGTHTGFFDSTVLLIGVRRTDGRLDALVVNYGCHPVTLGPKNLQISADYVGCLKDEIEHNGGVGTTMFALSGAADINPRAAIRTGKETPQTMGSSWEGWCWQRCPIYSPWRVVPWSVSVSPGHLSASGTVSASW